MVIGTTYASLKNVFSVEGWISPFSILNNETYSYIFIAPKLFFS